MNSSDWKKTRHEIPAPGNFVPLPDEPLRISWPTENRSLFAEPEKFFARTRANAEYGRPGFTRDCGRRFHRGCDIAPVAPVTTGGTTTVMFSDCATGTEYASKEPTFVCDEGVFVVFGGVVAEVNADEASSLLGLHVIIEHRWPVGGGKFFTLYAHLRSIAVVAGETLRAGQVIGRMGQTSSSADARNWMAIAPHLHFETWDDARAPHDPELFLRTFLPR